MLKSALTDQVYKFYLSIGGVFQENNLIGKVIQVYDIDGRRIDERNWQRPPYSSISFRLLGYIGALRGFVYEDSPG